MKTVNHKQAQAAIAALRPFLSSNMRGESVAVGVRSFGTGRAYPDTVRVMEDSWRNGGMDYVVYSYQTPIAWHDSEGWHIPADKFSPTTSKHQTYVRRAVSA